MLDQFPAVEYASQPENGCESIKAFSETDFTADLETIDVPTLVMHGEADQIIPVHDSARKSAWLTTGTKEIYYPDVRPV